MMQEAFNLKMKIVIQMLAFSGVSLHLPNVVSDRITAAIFVRSNLRQVLA